MDETIISVKNLKKVFKVPHERQNSLKSKAVNIFSNKKYTKYNALEDISFEIKKGEFFGIVGKNGCGKSTLLKILANIYQPTGGDVYVGGTIAPFIELGVGFNPELTGRENVFLSGTILGMPRKKIEHLYNEIVDFAELKEFMDQKLKNYSSGMQVRLAFSIAIRADSDILLIDEVLAVGDSNFQIKCFNFFKRMKKSGRTIVFVSHDMSAIQEYCDRAALIDKGKLAYVGESTKVAKKYNELNILREEKAVTNKNGESGFHTNDSIYIVDVGVYINKKKVKVIRPDDEFIIKMKLEAKKSIDNPVVGITIKTIDGYNVFVTNTKLQKIETGHISKGDTFTVDFTIKNIFSNGTYLVSPAVASEDTKIIFDWLDDFLEIQVMGWETSGGLVQPKNKIKVTK